MMFTTIFKHTYLLFEFEKNDVLVIVWLNLVWKFAYTWVEDNYTILNNNGYIINLKLTLLTFYWTFSDKGLQCDDITYE